MAAVWPVLRNALRPGVLPVLVDKLWIRWRERRRGDSSAEALAFCRELVEDRAGWARARDAALWEEAEAFAERLRRDGELRLREVGVKMGGGGDYGLLYFLARWRRPAVIVETGVAAGYSSQAFLAALDANAAGHLWSSDFPYVRSTAARDAIGCVVEPRVRERWTLRLDGDVANLRGILSEVGAIDLFHYDSDKSWTGRERTMAAVLPRLRADAWWIMDDIQDNAWFARWARTRRERVRVFEFGGKYLGLVAPESTPAGGVGGA